MDGISQALGIVSILEQPEDWRPPQNIWHHPERVSEFLKRKQSKSARPENDFSTIEHDPGLDNSEAQQYLRENGLI